MNFTVVRLSPVTAQLKRIADLLERILQAYELELAHKEGLHVHAPIADTSGPEPEAYYVDDELEALREQVEQYGKMTPSMQRFFDGEGQ